MRICRHPPKPTLKGPELGARTTRIDCMAPSGLHVPDPRDPTYGMAVDSERGGLYLAAIPIGRVDPKTGGKGQAV
jgi:hypothetical protein